MYQNQELFMQPEVTQHNSHMVMTGVKKQLRKKRLNVDTRFCDDYNVNTNALVQPVANFNLTLPERVNEIRSMLVTHLEVPLTYYNVSDSLGNNTLLLSSNAVTSAQITVPNGNYTTPAALIAAINAAIAASPFAREGVAFSLTNGNFCTITNTGSNAVTVTFGAVPQGKSIPCSERNAMIRTVESLKPTGVALNNVTAANPNAARDAAKITMKPEDFYTSSQRTARQAAAAQCLKQAPLPITNVFAPSSAVQVNTTSTNSNLNQNIQDLDVLPFRLGWLLGFRATTLARLSVTVPASGQQQGPAFVDVNGPRYLYLVVDEFLNGNPHTFTTMLKTSQIKNNVLARVAVPMSGTSPFGSVLAANLFNGLLVSDTRTYSNKVNLQRLNVQLVNELGVPMNLNGLDFSFCLEMEFE
jgi:hypothetical protein